eukprot:36527-Eustigmatos_ZCMA.PRE.1
MYDAVAIGDEGGRVEGRVCDVMCPPSRAPRCGDLGAGGASAPAPSDVCVTSECPAAPNEAWVPFV